MQDIIQFVIQHPVLITFWIILILILLCSIFENLISKIQIITCSEATFLINREDAIVVDTRNREEYRKGHIAGSINLLLAEIKTNNLSKLGKNKTKPIIIIDDTDMQAQKPANLLIQVGFKKVCILKQGISGWIEENLPLVCEK